MALRGEARREYDRKRMQEKRSYINEYKLSSGCEICGYSAHPAALQLDHLNPSLKDKEFSTKRMTQWSYEKINEELSKCRVLCANCHAVETIEKKQHLTEYHSSWG